MLVPQLILETLEDFLEDDFKKFKWFLTIEGSDKYRPIPRARIEHASRFELVSKIIDTYGDEMAVQITEDILTKMQQMYAAKKLRSAYTEGMKAASSNTSSTVAPPSAPAASVSAQHGSVVIAPTLTSGTTGSWNITINKP